MNPFSVHPSNYRRRPRVRFSSHWERTRRAESRARVVDALILIAGLATLGAFTLKVFGVIS